MPIDGWTPETDEDIIDFSKDGTTALYGGDEDNQTDTDNEQQPQIEATDEDNALTAIIDIGLDMVEGICKDTGYPQPNRTIWENHGKKAMNKAVNTLCPAGTGTGTVINSPYIGLIIGIGCLALCMYPVISYKLKEDKNKKQQLKEQPPEDTTSPTQTADNNTASQMPIKLPGGGDDATPNIPMQELIRRNLESGGEPTEI